MQEKGETQSSC